MTFSLNPPSSFSLRERWLPSVKNATTLSPLAGHASWCIRHTPSPPRTPYLAGDPRTPWRASHTVRCLMRRASHAAVLLAHTTALLAHAAALLAQTAALLAHTAAPFALGTVMYEPPLSGYALRAAAFEISQSYCRRHCLCYNVLIHRRRQHHSPLGRFHLPHRSARGRQHGRRHMHRLAHCLLSSAPTRASSSSRAVWRRRLSCRVLPP